MTFWTRVWKRLVTFRSVQADEKYRRLNEELAEKGSNFRWVEVVPGEWYCVGTMHLEKPIPPLRTFHVKRGSERESEWFCLGQNVLPKHWMDRAFSHNVNRHVQQFFQILFESDPIQEVRFFKFHEKINVTVSSFLSTSLGSENPDVFDPVFRSQIQYIVPFV